MFRLSRYGPILSAILAVSFLAAAPVRAEEPVEFGRYPFLPELTVNKEPAVCEPFLANMTAQFRSARSVDVLQNLNAIPWEDRWGNDEFVAVDADIDGDGDLDLILQDIYSSPSDGATIYSTIALDDRDEFIAKADSATSWDDFRELKAEYLGKAASGFGGLERPLVFSFSGGVYAFISPRWSDRPLRVYRLALGADWKEVCRVSFYPHSFLDSQNRAQQVRALPAIVGPGLRSLLAPLRATLSKTECGGTMRSDSRHERGTTITLRNALYRPWAIRNAASEDSRSLNSLGHVLIEEWAHTGFWEAQTYKRIVEARTDTVAELRGWYEREFGLPDQAAQLLAEQAVQQLIDNFVLVPSYFAGRHGATAPDWREGLNQLGPGNVPQQQQLRAWFLRALREGGVKDVERFLKAGADATQTTNPQHIYYRTEPAFFLAIDRPDVMAALLADGVDPNQANDFGKTPLMYAAQFDLVESAETLLKRGADPNLKTGQLKRGCGYLRYTGRTALMYAAENADEQMMALLIEAGAETDVADSGKRRIVDYLALNEELTEAERAAIAARWNLQ